MHVTEGRTSALLSEYEQLYYRDTVLLQTVVTTLGVGVTLVGGVLLAVPDFGSKKASSSFLSENPYAYALVPLPSILVMGLLAYLALQVHVNAQYGHALESHFAEQSGEVLSPEALRASGHEVPAPASLRLASRLAGAGRSTATRAYTRLTQAIFALVVAALLGAPALKMAAVPVEGKVLALVAYVPLLGIIGKAFYGAIGRGRRVLTDAIRDLDYSVQHPDGIGIEGKRLNLGERGRSGRTLLSYLLVPRVADHVAKVAVITVGFALGRIAAPGSYASAGALGRLVLMVVVVEYLFYQGRYSWNDLRDASHDASHAASSERGRIPGPLTSQKASLILFSMLAKALIGFAIVVISWRGELVRVSVTFAAIWTMAVLYEVVRDRIRDGRDPKSLGWRRLAYLVFVLVGSGYCIRMIAGMAIGSEGRVRTATLAVMGATLWLLETSTVAIAWTLEGGTFLRARRPHPLEGPFDYDRALCRKAHIGFLLRQAGLLTEESEIAPGNTRWWEMLAVDDANGLSRVSNEAELKHLRKAPLLARDYNGQSLTVWSIAGSASLVVGSVGALACANGLMLPPLRIAVPAMGVAVVCSFYYFYPSSAYLGLSATLMTASQLALAYAGGFAYEWLAPLLAAVVFGFYEFSRRGTYELGLTWLRSVAAVVRAFAVKVRSAVSRLTAWFAGSADRDEDDGRWAVGR